MTSAADMRVDPDLPTDHEAGVDPATVDVVLEAIAPADHGEGALVIVCGAPGAGCTGTLRRSVARDGRPSLWVHAMPGSASTTQGCIGQWVSGDDESNPPATSPMLTDASGSTMAEFLAEIDEHLEPGTVVVVDNFHLLTPASANALLVWSQVARMRGVALLLGYHASLDAAGVGALLTIATDVQWIDLHWLSDEQVRSALTSAARWSGEDLLDIAVAATAGNPTMLRCVRRALDGAEDVCPQSWPKVHRSALEAFGLGVLTQQGQDVQGLARVVSWVHPHVSVADTAAHLGMDAHVADRAGRLLRELALVTDDETVMVGVREALFEHSSSSLRQRCARAAQALLIDRTGTSTTRFELVTAAMEDLTGERDLACTAYREAVAAGEAAQAVRIATCVFERSRDDDERAWARAARLRVWLQHDWGRAAQELAVSPGAGAPCAAVASAMSPLFGLEAPRAARALLASTGESGYADLDRRLWAAAEIPRDTWTLLRGIPTGEPAFATWLAMRSLMGRPAGAMLAAADSACAENGDWLNTDAHRAVRLAAAWLGIADYDRAQQWAALATFNASPQEHAERGLGHLLRAQSVLRQGDLPRAQAEADAAESEFAAVGAINLQTVAALTRVHADVESRDHLGPMPTPLGGDVHPLFAAYERYVAARHALATGGHQEAVRQFFESGRALQRICPNNPSLTNWRLHLTAIFRASGQGEFIEHIEQDLLRSWRRWAAVEPGAVARRGEVLGRLADDLGAETEPPVGLDVLSPAERRVVDVVAEGKSNREVATLLFLSKRTVDTHLGNVYRKLGIDSRDQLRALVAAHSAGSGSEHVAYG